MTDFFPSDYKLPQTGVGYMKLVQGDNVFRVLSSPIIGWEDWDDKKPIRFRMNEKPASSINPKQPIKHFWAMAVWNYSTKAVEILEITQKTIQGAIKTLVDDEDWGKPQEYDIKIVREGEGMETNYSVNPKPKKEVSAEIKEAFSKKKINLDALFSGANPFEEAVDTITIDDIPFN